MAERPDIELLDQAEPTKTIGGTPSSFDHQETNLSEVRLGFPQGLDFQRQISDASTHSQYEDDRQWQRDGDTTAFLGDLSVETQKLHQSKINDIYNLKQVNILFTGQTGSGKSTLANAFLGSNNFTTGHSVSSPCTTSVTGKEIQSNAELKVLLWDSPGLRDGQQHNQKYLKEIKAVVKHYDQYDLIIFCIKADVRFILHRNSDDVKIMKMLSKKLDKRIWERTVFAITFANNIERCFPDIKDPRKLEESFQDTITAYKEQIGHGLKNFLKVDANIADNIHVIPAGYISYPDLPGQKSWFSNFWFKCLYTIPTVEGRAGLIESQRDRFMDEEDATDDDLVTGKIILTEKFIPAELLKKEFRGKVIGGDTAGLIGLLGGPLFLAFIPLGVWAGGRIAEKKYMQQFQQ